MSDPTFNLTTDGDMIVEDYEEKPFFDRDNTKDGKYFPFGHNGDSEFGTTSPEVETNVVYGENGVGRKDPEDILEQARKRVFGEGSPAEVIDITRGYEVISSQPADVYDKGQKLAAQQRQQMIEEKLAGADKAGKIATFSSKDMDIKDFGTNNKDMDYLNLDKMASKSIYLRYGIPLPLVTEDAATYNNVQNATLYFYENTIIPHVSEIFEGFSKFLLPRFGLSPTEYKITYNPSTVKPIMRQTLNEIEQRRKIAQEVFTADIFLVGTNAITLDGKLVNIDAWGNRVAAMVFGPDKVIIVAGVNKIVKDVNEALERIHNYAAPLNAKRHSLKHQRKDFGDLPCARTGICVDCNHDWRICRYTVIIEGAMIREKGRINIVLVGETLGI